MLTDDDYDRIARLLDEKLDKKLQPIYADIKSLKTDIGMLKDYIELDAKGVDAEVSGAVRPRLVILYPGCKISKFPLKNLFKYNSELGVREQVTDFDGAFLVSNQQTERMMFAPETLDPVRSADRRAATRTLSKDLTNENAAFRNDNPVHVLVIVEGKHVATRIRINNKIETLSTILDMIVKAKGYANREADGRPDTDFDENTKNLVTNFGFDKITNVQMYIGAPVWHDDMVGYVRDIANGKIKQLIRTSTDPPARLDMLKETQTLAEIKEYNQLGMVFPFGNRYQLADFYNQYQPENDFVPINGGGRCVRRRVTVRSIPIHVPYKFT